tara:strand:+ start:6 stop:1253 length:1248 start_codon:yes stop_codon:yes gene_type:complete
MEVKKPIYCALAFGGLSLIGKNSYTPCCALRPTTTDEWKPIGSSNLEFAINNKNFTTLRKKLIEGDWPKACQNCKIAEQNTNSSMRTIWNDELKEYDIPMDIKIDPINVRHLNLTFSNKCNSKCMTCNSNLSNLWAEEEIKLGLMVPTRANTVNPIGHITLIIDERVTHRFVDLFPNVVSIGIVGGEPTVQDEVTEYLNLLVDAGYNKKIKLSMTTNLTGITDSMLELWSKFKQVHFNLSIDGKGLVNDYIRYPFKWNRIDRILHKVINIVKNNPTQYTIGLSNTVSLFNAIQTIDLIEYWYDTSSEHDIIGGIFFNYVSVPLYTKINLLSLEYRQSGIDKILKLEEKIKSNEKNQHFIEPIQQLKSWLSEEQETDQIIIDDSKYFITESDKFRNRHIKDYIPELWEELNRIWNK